MEHTTMGQTMEIVEFAKRAADCFSSDDKIATFTDARIESGCLFALRWGLGDDCVVVFRLGDMAPVCFDQLIEKNKGE